MGIFALRKIKKLVRLSHIYNNRAYLIYERKHTNTNLSRWIPLCSSKNDFRLDDERITILSNSILSINVEGIKISKRLAEICLIVNGKVVRSYTEERGERLHWVKVTYAGNFKKGDTLDVISDGIGEIQVTIIEL